MSDDWAIEIGVERDPQKIAEAKARNLDKRLRAQARAVAHSMERFKPLIDKAKAEKIHVTLGFRSWTAYIVDVIGNEMTILPVDDRRQIVALLAGEGMSNRAIATTVGVNEITVRRDKDEVRHDVAPGAAVDADVVESKPVTGLDGKTYQPHKPKPALDAANVADAIKNDPGISLAAREAIKEREREHALEKAKRDNVIRDDHPGPIDEMVSITITVRKVKRDLTALLGKVAQAQGSSQSKSRRVIVDSIEGLREIIDVIASVAAGESMDVELKQLLGGDDDEDES